MTLSEKPVDGDYSLFTQADRTERVLSSHDVGPAVIVAHDVGDTVAAELLLTASTSSAGPRSGTGHRSSAPPN